MAETDFIVAIELGSSKIVGLAGKKNSDGSIQILAGASEDSSSFIRKGVIYNLNKTAQSLTTIINTLEGKLDAEIAKVYVGIGGQSLRSVKNTVARQLDVEESISEKLVDEIIEANTEVPLVDFKILGVVPQEYRIGNSFTIDPVGVLGNNIEGRFLNVIARERVQKNLESCFAQANIDVAQYFISPLAMANVVLTDAEKRSGCALVDFGADTTTISVYKNNLLRYLTVLPIGSESITRDICNLQIEEPEAERLKLKYGNAVWEFDEEDEAKMIQLSDGRTIKQDLLNDIVEARAEEIIANVWTQIQASGYSTQLLAGIVLTGGGANLQRMKEAVCKYTKIDIVKIVRSVLQGVKVGEPDVVKNDGTYNTILGLLFAGEKNCCKPKVEEVKSIEEVFGPTVAEPTVEEPKEKPKKKEKEKKVKDGKSAFDRIREKSGRLFGGLFDDDEK